MPRILHIATDEKFINAANFVFEKAFPESNTFLIVKPSANPVLRYVKAESNVEFIVQSSETRRLIINRSRNYDVVVLHGVDSLKADVFLADEHKEKYWGIVWGAEVYNENTLKVSLLGPKTTVLSQKLERRSLIETLKSLYRRVRTKDQSLAHVGKVSAAISQLINIVSCFREEFDFFMDQKAIKANAKFIQFNYYPLEFLFKDESARIKGNNILVGNSASLTNNHLEAIDILSKLTLSERRVYIPLSYGDSRYAKEVTRYAKQRLPRNAEPVEGFLPLAAYNELISNCGIVVMNHYRQQAVGNILAAIYLGAKVFLNRTTLYDFLKRLGCCIYLIEEDLVLDKNAFQLLTESQVMHNRDILRREISLEKVIDNLQSSMRAQVGV